MKEREAKSVGKSRKKQKAVVITATVVLAAAAVTAVVWEMDGKENMSAPFVAEIKMAETGGKTTEGAETESVAVGAEELAMFLSDEKSDTLVYFQEKYNAEYTEHFWTEDFLGEVPLETAVDNALEELAAVKAKQCSFLEHGITDDISYTQFKKELEEENERRASGEEVIYGPEQYTAEVYYGYLNAAREEALKEKLLEEGRFQAEGKELTALYEKYKTNLLKSPGVTIADEITIPYGDDKEKSREMAETISIAAGKDISLTEAAEKEGTEYTAGEFRLDKDTINSEEIKYSRSLINTALGLNKNETSVIDTGTAYKVLKCTEKEKTEYLDQGEAESILQNIYFEQQFQKMLDEKTKQAEIKKSDNIYEVMKKYIDRD